MKDSPSHSPDPGLLVWTLPDELSRGNHEAAVALVDAYYAEKDGHVSYSGARFDVLDGGGDRAGVHDRFTYADQVAMGLVSAPLKRHSILTLLGEHEPEVSLEINRLLRILPTDLDLVHADDAILDTADEVWKLLVAIDGIAWVTASKLMARKRPRLIPLIDKVVRDTLRHPRDGKFWRRLRAYLRTDDLHARLLRIRDSSDAPAETSAIRIFDIIVWMVGKGR